MKHIEYKHIVTGLLLLVVACICVMIGFLKWFFFIPAVLLVICYFFFDKKYLRCPHCGAFTNLDRLLYAKKHTYHCHGCGEILHIR